ncbi:MAG: hypothetical protein AVDCRST_MAG33-2821, partial [uncultured Thermomicrobiales bacterium]
AQERVDPAGRSRNATASPDGRPGDQPDAPDHHRGSQLGPTGRADGVRDVRAPRSKRPARGGSADRRGPGRPRDPDARVHVQRDVQATGRTDHDRRTPTYRV